MFKIILVVLEKFERSFFNIKTKQVFFMYLYNNTVYSFTITHSLVFLIHGTYFPNIDPLLSDLKETQPSKQNITSFVSWVISSTRAW